MKQRERDFGQSESETAKERVSGDTYKDPGPLNPKPI